MEVKAPIAVLIALATMQTAQFRAGVEAVRVDVLVVDGGKPLADLTADDFELRDNGVVQTIESVGISDVPISMMVALDTSESVAGHTLQELKEGVSAAAAALRPADRAALIAFASDVRLTMDWGNDAAAVPDALSRLSAGGGTALWDAAQAALTFSDDAPTVRRLVLVFSDGDDTSSWLPRDWVLEKARRTDVVVYAVEIRAPYTRPTYALHNRAGTESFKAVSDDGSSFLDELADSTGGSRFRITDAVELRKAFARVLTEFRTRYLMTYTAQGVDQKGWHALEVKLKTKKGKVTARRGYMR
jgi:Ca-activated chloride channel family protein